MEVPPPLRLALVAGDHHLQRDPPQPAGTFGEVAGDVDGAGCVKLTHHRQRGIPVVAITVIEGEAGKAPREVALLRNSFIKA